MALTSGPSPAKAQTTLPTYFVQQSINSVVADRWWTDPPGWTHDPKLMGMVHVNVGIATDVDPTAAADRVMDYIQARLNQPTPTLDPANITVAVLGFAHCSDEIDPSLPTCILHDGDPITPANGEPLDWGGNAPLPTSQRWYEFLLPHPWMNQSRARLTQWMATFSARIVARHLQDEIPLPRRYVFDAETPLISCCATDWSYHILNVRRDARWATEPVPGYDGPPKTMAMLENELNATLGWSAFDGDPTCPDISYHKFGFRPQWGGPHEIPNRPFTQMYLEVMQRVKAALMRDCAYLPIRAAYATIVTDPPVPVPVPVMSNYGEYFCDGNEEKFGWFWDRELSASCITLPGAQEPDIGCRQLVEPSIVNDTFRFPSRTFPRVHISPYAEGARWGHTWVKTVLEEPTPLTNWFTVPTMTWADLDSVTLYAWTNPFPGTGSAPYSFRRPNLYLPSHPLETPWRANHRMNRMRWETTIGSQSNHLRANPYFLMPPQQTDFETDVGKDDIRRCLSLGRQLDVRQGVAHHSGKPAEPITLIRWQNWQELYRQVYAFQVSDFYWSWSTGWSNVLPVPADLFFTLRTQESAPKETVTSAYAKGDEEDLTNTQLIVLYTPLIPNATGNGLRINIETQISYDENPTPCGLDIVEGEIYLWDYTGIGGGQWVRLLADGSGRYSFTTPDFSARRTFDVCDASRFMSSSGQVKLLARHVTTLPCGEFHFQSAYDLIQVIRLGDPPCTAIVSEGECEDCVGMAQSPTGPDINMDESVDSADLLMMGSAFGAGEYVADYDADGAVTSEDVVTFLVDFANSGQ